MKKFDNELLALQQRMGVMADKTKAMVRLAALSIKDRSADVYQEVVELEGEVDQLQMAIDGDAVRLLTVYGPVATDLRFLLVVTHVNAQLERVGDQVVNICESLQLMRTDLDQATPVDLVRMADLVQQVVDDSLDAYFAKDAEKAEATRSQDDLVDALNAKIMKQLLGDEDLQAVLKGTKDLADALAQILIARHLERIADQGVNICKEVVYMVRGDDVRHRH